MGKDTSKVSQHSGLLCQIGPAPGLSGWQLPAQQKGGEDLAYWKGKGGTVHLITADNDLPLAFPVTAADVSEATVGLEVLDQVKVAQTSGPT